MNRAAHPIACVLASFALTVLQACATMPSASLPAPAFDAALPAVAAQYRTEVRAAHAPSHASEWRFWRSGDRIERENLAERTGELWQRDGATLFHTKLYHADRRGIEFQPGDMALLGAQPAWLQQAWIINPEVFGHLEQVSAGERKGIAYRRYKGTFAGAHWDVTLRMDLMLPQLIERRQGERIERIELREVYALAQAPWQPTPSRDYGMIDFADLGDHERDPFVLRLQATVGGHAHQH